MFYSARIKLTAWYLTIIMVVSFSFSAFIYKSVTFEFQRRFDVIETRLELRRLGFDPPPGQVELFFEDLNEARKRIILTLLYTNAVVFVFSALAGYFLAGKTLAPIEKLLNEQKRFMADASHELKTPLTIMKTSIEVALRDKKLNLNNAKQVLKETMNETDNLSSLTNDLLSISRLANNNINFENIESGNIINLIIKKFTPLAVKKKIKINKTIKNTTINANKDYFEKLISILIDNSIKYSKSGGEISVKSSGDKKYLKVIVKDNGIGINKDDLPHIFERFYRAEASRSKTQVPGFGLGLSLAKQIVELHKGKISVESIQGKGSMFILRLPINLNRN